MLWEPRKRTRKDRNNPNIKKPWESQIPIRNRNGKRIERRRIWTWDDEPVETEQSSRFPVVIISRHDSKGRRLAEKALEIIKEHRLCKINHHDIGEEQFVMTFRDEASAVTFKLLWDEKDD